MNYKSRIYKGVTEGVIPPEISISKMIGIKRLSKCLQKMELKGDDHAAAGLYRPGLWFVAKTTFTMTAADTDINKDWPRSNKSRRENNRTIKPHLYFASTNAIAFLQPKTDDIKTTQLARCRNKISKPTPTKALPINALHIGRTSLICIHWCRWSPKKETAGNRKQRFRHKLPAKTFPCQPVKGTFSMKNNWPKLKGNNLYSSNANQQCHQPPALAD